jgi:hypothetical protein
VDDPLDGYLDHMAIVVLICLIVAAVFFGIAVFNVPARINLIAAGLLAWVLAFLIPAIAAAG